jgi:hypothetical protein
MATEQTITISEKTIGGAPKPKSKIDVQDVLFLIGFGLFESGIFMWSHAAALVLAGVLLMVPVLFNGRSK